MSHLLDHVGDCGSVGGRLGRVPGRAAMTAEEILAKAADLVEESWAQGDANIRYDGGPYCAGVALNKAAKGYAWGICDEPDVIDTVAPKSPSDQAWRAFCLEIGITRIDNIPIWNDMPGRTQEEVATSLRSAKRWL